MPTTFYHVRATFGGKLRHVAVEAPSPERALKLATRAGGVGAICTGEMTPTLWLSTDGRITRAPQSPGAR